MEEEAGMDLINSFVGRHPFSTVAGDNDQGRRARLYGRSPEEIDVLEQQRKYVQLLYIFLYMAMLHTSAQLH